MGLVITAICLVLAYPLAYLLANLPTRQSNLLMIWCCCRSGPRSWCGWRRGSCCCSRAA
jgi:hypothetical protein